MLENILQLQGYIIQVLNIVGRFELKKPSERLFVPFLHSTDSQSLTKIQIALKTKRLFISLKQKTYDSKFWTELTWGFSWSLLGVNEFDYRKINTFDSGVLLWLHWRCTHYVTYETYCSSKIWKVLYSETHLASRVSGKRL